MLLTGRTSSKKDRVETEAVVQASEIGAMVIVDDRRGQKLADSYALEHHDTIWVLDRLQALGLLAPRTLREYLQRLKTSGIHLRAANELLRRLGEKELQKLKCAPAVSMLLVEMPARRRLFFSAAGI